MRAVNRKARIGSWHWIKRCSGNFRKGVREADLKLISDNGCQPTSISFMQNCRDLYIEQIFTSYNNPKGNADTERFMRTMKEDCLWLKNWTVPQMLIAELNRWIEVDYNLNYCHSSLRRTFSDRS